MKSAQKKVLVTGAGGFIGSHLCETLVGQGYSVKALIRYNSRNYRGWLEDSPLAGEIEFVTGDIRNFDSVRSAMQGVTRVFHLAALIGIPYSYSSPDSYVDTNVKGTLNMLQAGRDAGLERFVHTSTSEVYGTARTVPINESHPLNPQSPYAASKVGADALALSFFHSFALPVAVVRPFNTYGPRQSARAIIPTIITQILDGKRAVSLGSLTPTRDFTFVQDTVDGFLQAGTSPAAVGEVINLGTGREISVKDLLLTIAGLMKVKVRINSEARRQRPKDSEVRRLCSDYGKARRLLRWEPKVSIEEGLEKTIAWFRDHKTLYDPGLYHV